ncbi:MAG: hypothetical protein JWR85_4216 [Marmoricola sp.]|nr:hypothetical protein [Marmoricola sp.]
MTYAVIEIETGRIARDPAHDGAQHIYEGREQAENVRDELNYSNPDGSENMGDDRYTVKPI